VEVVHGEWEIIEDDYFDLVKMKCSVCGESYGFEDYEDDTPQNYHYCPNCGADMRERKEDV
jgi:NAD-dependent SIR2 family protein deacetylase